MRDLIQRLQDASEGSRELDALIRCAVYAPSSAYVEQSPINGAWCVFEGADRSGRARLWEGPGRNLEFTRSIDAAMTLLPAVDNETGVFWQLSNDGDGANPSDFRGRVLVCSLLATSTHIGTAATPAIALCIAALQASNHKDQTP